MEWSYDSKTVLQNHQDGDLRSDGGLLLVGPDWVGHWWNDNMKR